MIEKIAVFLLFFGGFIVAFVCLVYATIARDVRPLRWLLIIAAFCGLIYEGGCLTIAAGIGRATSGNSSGEQVVNTIMAIAFLVAIIWSLLLAFHTATRRKDQQRNGSEPSDQCGKSESN